MRSLPLVAALSFLLAAGCSKKPDCRAYGSRYADAIGAAPGRANTVAAGATRDCERGRVDAKKFECVMSAKSADDLRACEGLSPAK